MLPAHALRYMILSVRFVRSGGTLHPTYLLTPCAVLTAVVLTAGVLTLDS